MEEKEKENNNPHQLLISPSLPGTKPQPGGQDLASEPNNGSFRECQDRHQRQLVTLRQVPRPHLHTSGQSDGGKDLCVPSGAVPGGEAGPVSTVIIKNVIFTSDKKHCTVWITRIDTRPLFLLLLSRDPWFTGNGQNDTVTPSPPSRHHDEQRTKEKGISILV